MKSLSLNQMEGINGSRANPYVAGFCAGVSVVRFGAWVGLFAINPAAGGVMLGVVGGCIAYGIYSNLD